MEEGELVSSTEKHSHESVYSIEFEDESLPGTDPVRRNLGHTFDEMNESIFNVGGARAKSVTFAQGNEALGDNQSGKYTGKQLQAQAQADAKNLKHRRQRDVKHMNKQYRALNEELTLLVRSRDSMIEENQGTARVLAEERDTMIRERDALRASVIEETENAKQSRASSNAQLGDITARIKQENSEAERLRTLRDKYCTEVDQIQNKFNLCRIDIDKIEVKHSDYQNAMSKIQSEYNQLVVKRDQQVQDNENVRADIIQSNKDLLEKRDRETKIIADLEARKMILEAYVQQTEQKQGAPDHQIDTTQLDITNHSLVGQYPGGASTPHGGNQGVIRYHPFVNDQANRNVGQGVYKQGSTVLNVVNHNVPNQGTHQVDPYANYNQGVQYNSNGSVNLGVQTPIRKHNRRSTMSLGLQQVYDNNPCISSLGVDCYSTGTDGTEIIAWSIQQAKRLKVSKNAARRVAKQIRGYDGKKPWKESYENFLEILECNGWGKDDSLAELICWLKDGPGKMAISQWRTTYGTRGTFDELVECASYLFGTLIAEDPMTTFRNRTQKPDESFKVYGLYLQDLLHKARPSWPYDAEYFIQELFSQYLKANSHEYCARTLEGGVFVNVGVG